MYRLPLQTQGFLNAKPRYTDSELRYIAFRQSGYHLVTADEDRYGLIICGSTTSSSATSIMVEQLPVFVSRRPRCAPSRSRRRCAPADTFRSMQLAFARDELMVEVG